MDLGSLIDLLENRTLEHLRFVQWFRGGQSEVVYLRDDLDREAVTRRGRTLHQRLKTIDEAAAGAPLEDLGANLATVNLCERGVMMYFPAGGQYGVVVGLDPDVARDLHRFVEDCRTHVDKAVQSGD